MIENGKMNNNKLIDKKAGVIGGRVDFIFLTHTALPA